MSEELQSVLAKYRERLKEINRLEMHMFRLESAYLEATSGSPIIKTTDFYLNNRTNKKKNPVEVPKRIFARDYPCGRK